MDKKISLFYYFIYFILFFIFYYSLSLILIFITIIIVVITIDSPSYHFNKTINLFRYIQNKKIYIYENVKIYCIFIIYVNI